MLRRLEAVILKWFSRQLHHTAMGLPFQPSATGPIETRDDPIAALRVLFTAYWTFGQQGYLLLEHFGEDLTAYDATFIQGLITIGSEISSEAVQRRPPRPYDRP
jgi:hypothetical protein